MSFKDRLRSRRSKRFGNVEDDCQVASEITRFSTSDSELDGFDSKDKVREKFSAKRLMKESQCFTVDNDHIYTSARPSEAVFASIRKRKISEQSNEKLAKKRCFSENAVKARLNRERKKKYVSALESENESLRKENNEMIGKIEEQSKKISVMKREIFYLKGLLANSKELEQILRNLKDVTGLPVTSSIITTSKTGIHNEMQEKVSTTEHNNRSFVEGHPRIRTVNSGKNFPILDKDINLGSCSDNSYNDLTDLENCPFHFENESYDMFSQNSNEDEDFFSFGSKNFDLELEEYFRLENLTRKNEPEAGICLHVNQKRISLEICSICSSKAASLGDAAEELLGQRRRRNLDEK